MQLVQEWVVIHSLSFEGSTMGLLEDLEALLKPPLQEMGAALSRLDLTVEKGQHVLHVVISRSEGPVDLDYIVKATELISPLLDGANLIAGRYLLDVSSAGIEKDIPLEELPKHVGGYIRVSLRKPWRGENVLEATLTECTSESITLEGRLKAQKYQTQISMADIDKVREAIKF
jgi:ribosome maturation factor RimP